MPGGKKIRRIGRACRGEQRYYAAHPHLRSGENQGPLYHRIGRIKSRADRSCGGKFQCHGAPTPVKTNEKGK